jgi:hypothetical protein
MYSIKAVQAPVRGNALLFGGRNGRYLFQPTCPTRRQRSKKARTETPTGTEVESNANNAQGSNRVRSDI